MKLTLVRGFPGSGKSTIAKSLDIQLTSQHIETDMYWERWGGYHFDTTKLKQAHEWCQENTEILLRNGYDVIVSNTFTTKKELRPYFEISKKFDIVPQVILCQGQYGNVHNVPKEVLQRMKARFEYDISELYESTN